MLNQATQITVGASLLAKAVNDDAGILTARGALKSFASKLAPTCYLPASTVLREPFFHHPHECPLIQHLPSIPRLTKHNVALIVRRFQSWIG